MSRYDPTIWPRLLIPAAAMIEGSENGPDDPRKVAMLVAAAVNIESDQIAGVIEAIDLLTMLRRAQGIVDRNVVVAAVVQESMTADADVAAAAVAADDLARIVDALPHNVAKPGPGSAGSLRVT